MEKKVADTLLEEKMKIVIGGEVLEMKPPSIATLVLASKYIRQLPSKSLSKDRLLSEMIQNADQLKPLGLALSAMILGVEEFNKKQNISWWPPSKKSVTKGEVLADKINKDDIVNVYSLFMKILQLMNLSVFFQLTTFLIELNITKTTKKVVN